MLLSTNANPPQEGQGSQTTSHTHPKRLSESKSLLAALQNTAPTAIPQPTQPGLPKTLLASRLFSWLGIKWKKKKKLVLFNQPKLLFLLFNIKN